ncbi:hypothetical protein HC928_00270 [bacterium]|nr:hypothetical protein [bacterium]
MRLYIRNDLVKSNKKDLEQKAGAGKPADVSGGKGEQRGGKYTARVQIGYEKDGSPKYRYFQTEEEYETYLQGKGRSKESKKLEHKVKQEHAESTDKQTGRVVHQPASKKPGLLSKDKVSKSLKLFVRS